MDAVVADVAGMRVGQIVGVRGGRWLVDYQGNPHGALVARTTLAVDADELRAAAASGREVLLVFERAHGDRPLVVALLEGREASVESVEVAGPALPDETMRVEARVDGRRVVVEADDELVLQCGEASITLRRNGRVVVRGSYVETRARGVNRIKGGTVQIN
jgi:hypothetical protein